MPTPRRTPLRLWLLALVLAPTVSLPSPAAPPPPVWPAYLHVSTQIADELLPIVPVAPAHACAGENLHRHLARWQRLLHLEDWQITIYCGLPETDDKWELAGKVHTFPDRRLAYIYVDPEGSYPLEEVVLHELLHVALAEMTLPGASLLEDPDEHLVQVLTERIYRSPVS